MATIAATSANFDSLTDQDGVVLIDWWAEWCAPCKDFAPIYEAASERHADVKFLKIETDAEQELAAEFMIQAIPTLMVFRDRIMLYAERGGLPAKALDELITQVKALDMEEVRKEIAKAEEEGDDHDHSGCDHDHDHDHDHGHAHEPEQASSLLVGADGKPLR